MLGAFDPPSELHAMSVPGERPQQHVVEPFSRALASIVARGTAGFAMVVGLVLASSWLSTARPQLSPAAHVLLPATFVVYAMVSALTRVRRRQTRRADAWSRAAAADAREALVATLVVAALPAGALLACLASLGPEVASPAQRAMAITFYAPATLALWFLAVTTWVGQCEATLAHAVVESDRRFRDYWSSLAGGTSPGR